MFSRYAFFDVAAELVLWGLTILGVLAALASWTAAGPDRKEGALTIGGRRLAWARVCLTAGCVAIWVATFLGSEVKSPQSPSLPFGFWQDYPVALQILFLPIDAVFAASVILAFQARGRGRLILLIAALIMAAASLAGSIFLWSP